MVVDETISIQLGMQEFLLDEDLESPGSGFRIFLAGNGDDVLAAKERRVEGVEQLNPQQLVTPPVASGGTIHNFDLVRDEIRRGETERSALSHVRSRGPSLPQNASHSSQ